MGVLFWLLEKKEEEKKENLRTLKRTLGKEVDRDLSGDQNLRRTCIQVLPIWHLILSVISQTSVTTAITRPWQ